MIKVESLGEIALRGTQADLLAEFAFITDSLARKTSLERNEVIAAFMVGLFRQEIQDSGIDVTKCWDYVERMADEMLGKEKEVKK